MKPTQESSAQLNTVSGMTNSRSSLVTQQIKAGKNNLQIQDLYGFPLTYIQSIRSSINADLEPQNRYYSKRNKSLPKGLHASKIYNAIVSHPTATLDELVAITGAKYHTCASVRNYYFVKIGSKKPYTWVLQDS